MTTNWQRHFGTPERAAEIIADCCGCAVMQNVATGDLSDGCECCPLWYDPELKCMADDEKWVLEWMESEVEQWT